MAKEDENLEELQLKKWTVLIKNTQPAATQNSQKKTYDILVILVDFCGNFP